MKWFIPSWNGDVRIETDPKAEDRSILRIVKPTLGEIETLGALGKVLTKRRLFGKPWLHRVLLWDPEGDQNEQAVTVFAPFAKVSAVVVKHLRPGKQVMTAIVMKDGKVETVETARAGEAETEALATKAEKDGKAAATVKRPTPSCPQCFKDAVGPATEALLSFLSPEQHDDWARHRYIIVTGGQSGHRYVLAHRHTLLAMKFGRICYDLEDCGVVHFHDITVPPEEEVLAAKLILEHREPWLRNEATLLGGMNGVALSNAYSSPAMATTQWSDIFKNPFGDFRDGIDDAQFTQTIGAAVMGGVGYLVGHQLTSG